MFETRATQVWRYFKNTLFIFFVFIFVYLCLGLFIVLSGKKETRKTDEAFYQTQPDLIVVFTGASGRIPYAIKEAGKFKQGHLFITGVHAKNSVNTLMDSLKVKDRLDPNLLQIDHSAKNTVENVLFTIRHLRNSKGLKKIMIISHDYHLSRIKMIVSNISREEKYRFYYKGVSSDFTKIKDIKILTKEVYKWIRTLSFLLFWETDSEIF